jgi:hypothetical protein
MFWIYFLENAMAPWIIAFEECHELHGRLRHENLGGISFTVLGPIHELHGPEGPGRSHVDPKAQGPERSSCNVFARILSRHWQIANQLTFGMVRDSLSNL